MVVPTPDKRSMRPDGRYSEKATLYYIGSMIREGKAMQVRVVNQSFQVVGTFLSENMARHFMSRNSRRSLYIHPDDIRMLQRTVSPFYQTYLKGEPRAK